MTTNPTIARRAGLFAAALLLSLAVAAQAAVITIVNNDGAGEGFNDPTVVAPVGGNPATTLGAQRLFVFQYAANIWGATLPSSVQILVNAQFNPLTCTATSAVLGSAGPVSVWRDFAGAPMAAHWYHAALANRLFGADLDAATYDINATFNSALNGAPACLGGTPWYLGTDGLEGTAIELLPVVLHELGHGLGFSTTTSGSTGNYLASFPSIFDFFLRDGISGLHWDQATPAQRVASAISLNNLTWDGPAVFTGATTFLAKRPRMLINSPGVIAGTYAVATGTVGVPLTAGGITGNVVLADDGAAPTGDGCTALVNAGAIAGNIALVDRGTCTFVVKALAAQAAGATALLIANNAAGLQPPGGADPSLTIPVVGISQADGNSIKLNLAGGVNVTLGLDPVLQAGADNSGRALMYAPSPYQSGSSVSHYDVTMTPNALMEPAINNDLHSSLDITPNLMADIGWFDFVVATSLSRFDATDRTDGIELVWQFGDASDVSAVTVERATSQVGPWEPVAVDPSTVDGYVQALDTSVQSDVTYYYRLTVMDRAGKISNYGMVAARHSANVAGGNVLMAPSPNPAPHGSALSFRISRPEFVKLAIVDATGRQVRVLQNAMLAPGTHTMLWDGTADGGEKVAPGLYFVTMRTSAGRASQRLAVVR
jgi:hypothetical protein